MPIYSTPQRPSKRDDGWPTRADIRYDTDAERLCRVLVGLVESMGASLSLTRAVTLLGQAREAIADHVERIDPEPPASDEPARQSPEPDSRRWGGSMRPMPDPYRADHNCVPEGCSECRPECRPCNGSGNAHTFDGDDVGICGTCHGTGSAAGGGL